MLDVMRDISTCAETAREAGDIKLAQDGSPGRKSRVDAWKLDPASVGDTPSARLLTLDQYILGSIQTYDPYLSRRGLLWRGSQSTRVNI